ncbi:MAG: ABC transporter substrate-binding protein, partial [Alphaproteobacteria bacterium]
VPWEDINWHCMRPEQLPVEFPPGVSVQRIPEGADIGEMLVAGEIDALISPQRPASTIASLASAGGKVRRLFRDPRAEDEKYFRKHGFFPVMHLFVIRRELAERMPGLAADLIDMWEKAKGLAWQYYEDPAYSLLAWGSNAYQAQQEVMGADPWPSGVAANHASLAQFLDYCGDQGLMDRKLEVEDLFFPAVRDT